MFTKKATFSSAMGMFTKANEELKAAQEENDLQMAEAQATVEACIVEKNNIDRVSSFFSNLLDGK